jgi:hypothetical protein
MTMFGMPPDDPEGLMPGIDGSIGFGDQGDSLADADVPPVDEVDETDESFASEAVRDPSPPTDDRLM